MSQPPKDTKHESKKNKTIARNKRHMTINRHAWQHEAEAARIKEQEQERAEGTGEGAQQANWSDMVLGDTSYSDAVRQVRNRLGRKRSRARSRWHHFVAGGGGTIGR